MRATFVLRAAVHIPQELRDQMLLPERDGNSPRTDLHDDSKRDPAGDRPAYTYESDDHDSLPHGSDEERRKCQKGEQ